jgi:uncharacterized membrane-anchored protein YhcB (DUF1043 family)
MKFWQSKKSKSIERLKIKVDEYLQIMQKDRAQHTEQVKTMVREIDKLNKEKARLIQELMQANMLLDRIAAKLKGRNGDKG